MSSPLAASCFLPFASFFSTLYSFLYPLQTSRNGEQLHTISNWCGKADLMTISLLSLSLPPTHFPEVFLARANFSTLASLAVSVLKTCWNSKSLQNKKGKKLFHRRRVLVAVGEWIYLRALQVFHPKISFTFFSICEWDASRVPRRFRRRRCFSHRCSSEATRKTLRNGFLSWWERRSEIWQTEVLWYSMIVFHGKFFSA